MEPLKKLRITADFMGRETKKARVLELHSQGLKPSEIKKIVGCSGPLVYKTLREARLSGELPDELSPSDQIIKLRNRVKALELLVAKLAAQVNRRIPFADPAPVAPPGSESDTLRSPQPPNRLDYMTG